MITTFEAGAVFKIVDRATSTLRTMSRGVATFDKAVNTARLNLEKLSTVKLGPVANQLKRITESAIALRPELAGLSRSLGTLDRRMAVLPATARAFGTELTGAFGAISTGATAALADMRALTAESRLLAASSRAVSRAALLPGRGRSAARVGGGGRHGGGVHVSGISQRIPGGHAYFHSGSNLGMAALGALGYGIYEEGEIEDIAARALITGQIKVDSGMRESDAFHAIRDTIGSVSTQTGFSPKEVGQAILTTERQFGGLDFMKRLELEKTLLPYAASEARMKETTLPVAFEAMVGLSHMTGTYDPKQLPELMRQFQYASMITPVPIEQFRKALSYSLPILHAGLGMSPESVMFLTAMTQTAGITNTKSGTWLRSMFENAIPHVGASLTKSEKNKNALLEGMGLVSGGHALWEVQGAGGKVDWDSSIIKLSQMIGDWSKRTPDFERLSTIHKVFGERGAGEAALFNLDQFISQFPTLMQKMKTFGGGEDVIGQLSTGSPVQQARNAFADLQKVLMDIGSIALPPVVRSLEVVDSVLKRIDKVLPSPGTPAGNAITGAGTGAALGFGFGKLVGQPMIGAAAGAGLGSVYAREGIGGVIGAIAGPAMSMPVAGPEIGGAIGRWWNSDAGHQSFVASVVEKIAAAFSGVTIQATAAPVNMDGEKVAQLVIKHVIHSANGPAEGAPYHDATHSTAPLDFALP